MKRRFYPIGLLAVFLAACAPAAPTATPAAPGQPRQERAENQALRIAPSSIPANLTPAAGFANYVVFTPMYDTPTTLGKDFAVEPAVATKWELSADGRTWTLTIRSDLVFHNGDRLTAEDVAFSINEMMQRGWPARTFINTVTEARATSPTTVDVQTRAIDMSIPAGFMFTPILPKAYYESVGGFDGFVAKPIGSGPYELVEFVREDRIVYRKRSSPHPFRNVQATELTFVAVPENSQKINGLRTGELDATTAVALTTDQVQTAETAGLKLQVIRNAFIFVAIPQGTYELRNTPLKDKRVRQAMNYAIDREAITKTLYRGYAEPLGQLALKGSQSWDPSVKPVYDPALARQLLAEAGYPNGFGGITMEMSRAQNLQDLMQVIQAQLREVGIRVELEIVDGALYGDRVYGRNNAQKSDLVMSGNGDTNGFNTAIRVLYGCGRPIGSPPSALFWCNPEWDRLQDAALAERDPTRRAQLLREANRIMREDAPVIPLYLPASFVVHSPKIVGIDVEGRTQITFDAAYRIK
ncbi:MAG: ABC transporter substrate-binding protein [Chloroflexota bacterium]|nr:ABC transporter substrate-binding protein [Dehalococcoidia bacterium]MDW8254512.1 ABC transporter substrate-binding protein [Chloroflexota bacterium]